MGGKESDWQSAAGCPALATGMLQAVACTLAADASDSDISVTQLYSGHVVM